MKILLSIRPEYANAIMNGAKTWEFRKKIPKRLCDGSVVVVYSTSPEKMVLGEFTVGRLLMGNLAGGENSSFWKEVDDGAYITWKSLRSYAGEDFVHAIEVKSVTRYDRPLFLKECYPGMKRPPQNFCYIDNPEATTDKKERKDITATGYYSCRRDTYARSAGEEYFLAEHLSRHFIRGTGYDMQRRSEE